MKRALIITAAILAICYALTSLLGLNYVYKALVYQHVDLDDYQIFENREIKAEQPKPWPQAKLSNAINLPDSLQAVFSDLETVSILLIRKDSILYEQLWPGYTAEYLGNSFSVAKSFISVLTGIALKDGDIKSLDQKAADFIPEFRDDERAQISIRHLLTMSSGLEFTEAYNLPISHTTESYYGTDLYSLCTRLKLVEEPGTHYRYKGCDPQLLAFILQKATGKSISEYLSEKLWSPLGAERAALWSLDKKDGQEKAYCCISAQARDFARLGKLMLDSGKVNGTMLLPDWYIKDATVGHGITDKEGKKTNYYGYYWWNMSDIGLKAYYARGILGQYVVLLPQERMILVRTGHNRGKDKTGAHMNEIVALTKWAKQQAKMR